jgi:predicted methyltransferase
MTTDAIGRGASPLLTQEVAEALLAGVRGSAGTATVSLDLGRTHVEAGVDTNGWQTAGVRYPHLEHAKPRTIYYWTGASFEPAQRFTTALYKLVPTTWGAPTFEIDGIKMLPTAHVSPYADAESKVALIAPRGKTVLDTCGGLGYFAAACLARDATRVLSYERSADVLWLRSLNPWSPAADERLALANADVTLEIAKLPSGSAGAALHDPPRFGIAGELYSQNFYDELSRVLVRRAKLFHYTGTPNKLTSGRDVPNEVAQRLERAGFATAIEGDGVLATKR